MPTFSGTKLGHKSRSGSIYETTVFHDSPLSFIVFCVLQHLEVVKITRVSEELAASACHWQQH
jgi:hypothetical protein